VTAAPKHHRVSAKAYAADVANLKKARAALKGRPRTAKQQAASRKNLVKARAVRKARATQKARTSGKPPVVAKKAAVPAPDTWTVDVPRESLLWLPACGPLAVAEHLAVFTGAFPSSLDVLALWEKAGVCSIGDLLEATREHGLAGNRLAYFERCDPDSGISGLLYGVQLGRGYHAALCAPGGMISWCRLVPREGTPEEAWWLEWENE